MNEIEHKITELAQLFETIPDDCKGDKNTINRHEFIKLKSSVNDMIACVNHYKQRREHNNKTE